MNVPTEARIANSTRGAIIATRARFAVKGAERRRGLLGRDSIETGEALLFPRCRQVHMFGMKFTIDVLFLDKGGRAVRCVSGLAPGHLSPWVRKARTAIELPAGTLTATNTREHDLIEIEPVL
jgi:uncharacterized protein